MKLKIKLIFKVCGNMSPALHTKYIAAYVVVGVLCIVNYGNFVLCLSADNNSMGTGGVTIPATTSLFFSASTDEDHDNSSLNKHNNLSFTIK